MTAESWRAVPGWSVYQVSDLGRVRRGGHILKPYMRDRYARVYLRIGTHIQNAYVHRLVLLAFKGQPPSGKNQAAHHDSDRSNNALTNLRWASARENAADSMRAGPCNLAGVQHRRRLPSEVLLIKSLLISGASQCEVSKLTGIPRSSIRLIKTKMSLELAPEVCSE